jgi:hypothetical protein
MSAHAYGAPGWGQRRREYLRQAALEQQHQQRRERENYLQRLAAKLQLECGVSEKVAIARVRAFSVLARQQREQHVSETFSRFG